MSDVRITLRVETKHALEGLDLVIERAHTARRMLDAAALKGHTCVACGKEHANCCGLCPQWRSPNG